VNPHGGFAYLGRPFSQNPGHERRGSGLLSGKRGPGAIPGKSGLPGRPRGHPKAFTVTASRPLRELTVLAFQEVQSIEEAQKLIGCSIYVNKSDLNPLPPDEFYWYQLQGIRVETEKGEFLGILEKYFPRGVMMFSWSVKREKKFSSRPRMKW